MLRSKVTINGIMLRIMMNEFRGTMEVSLSDRLNLARVDRLLAEAEGEMAGKVMVEMTGEVTGTKEEEIGMIGGMMIGGRIGTTQTIVLTANQPTTTETLITTVTTPTKATTVTKRPCGNSHLQTPNTTITNPHRAPTTNHHQVPTIHLLHTIVHITRTLHHRLHSITRGIHNRALTIKRHRLHRGTITGVHLRIRVEVAMTEE